MSPELGDCARDPSSGTDFAMKAIGRFKDGLMDRSTGTVSSIQAEGCGKSQSLPFIHLG